MGGRPTLFGSKKPRSINLTDDAYQKAEADAEVLSAQKGIRVSISEAIESAIRAFRAKGKA